MSSDETGETHQSNVQGMNVINRASVIFEEKTLVDEINDFIEENAIEYITNNTEEYELACRRMEELRSLYRSKHHQLRILDETRYTEEYASDHDHVLGQVKDYIKKLKDQKVRLLKEKASKDENIQRLKDEKFKFLEDEVGSKIRDLQSKCDIKDEDWSSKKDENVRKMKEELPDLSKELKSLSFSLKDMLDTSQDTLNAMSSFQTQKKSYETLQKTMENYIRRLEEEFSNRELEKRKDFDRSKLDLTLQKFKGYSSGIDFFKFKSEFNKMYLETTPKDLLPYLVKKNLENPALLLVKDLSNIDEIWQRLKEAYGDCNMMLKKRLSEVNNIEGLWISKDPTKTVEGLSKLISLMKNLMLLAKEHEIENLLYYGEGFEKIQRLLGDSRVTRWLSHSVEKKMDIGKEQWVELTKFLEKEVKVNQQKVFLSRKKDPDDTKKKERPNESRQSFQAHHEVTRLKCFICDQDDHYQTRGPGGSKLIQYFSCPKFVNMSPKERFIELKTRGFCFQCLYPGASNVRGKHKEGKCQKDFTCKHPAHERFLNGKKHVLVCEEHKTNAENKTTLEEYRRRCMSRQSEDFPQFSREISINHVYVSKEDKEEMKENDSEFIEENAIYMLQTIEVDGKAYSLFYDSGCKEFVSRHEAITQIGPRAQQQIEGPITLYGVGEMTAQSPHGIYSVNLPTKGQDATLTGVCMDVITEKFPSYPLNEIEKDIREAYQKDGGKVRKLPKLMKSVGGYTTDFMIGIKYLRYFPKEIFKLPSGLAIYKSVFRNIDGTYGVVGGPHKVITAVERQYQQNPQNGNFFKEQYLLFKAGYKVNADIPLLGYKDELFDVDPISDDGGKEPPTYVSTQKSLQKFFEAENAGDMVPYRCVNCRGCKACKENDASVAVSLREEVEQDVINRSITVDTKEGKSTAKLPLIRDPKVTLEPNSRKALAIYKHRIKKLNKNPDDLKSIIKAEQKLQDRGFVDYVRNLSTLLQKILKESPIQNFLVWNIVWKLDSLTTPCRPTFNGSLPTGSGMSLNDIIAKGSNNLNKLVEIFICWRIFFVAFHNDIQTMYNQVLLEEEYWCYQRYWWHPSLDPNKEPEEKVIKTLIYGVKSSGNQAECALRRTAELMKEEYPDVYETVMKHVYVDDIMSGCSSLDPRISSQDMASKRADELEIVLNKGGFSMKGFTMSGKDPDAELSKDGVSIGVAGHKWFPKEDMIALDVKDLNFAKKSRGKTFKDIKEIPEKLTRKMCASKAAEVFDMTGMITPITATWKVDLHDLVARKLDWEDVLPDNLRSIWLSHFEMMNEVKNLRYHRLVIPEDAADLNITTLDFGDASKILVCAAIYVRVLRKNNTYSCQLIFSRSKLVPENTSQPRAELFAAMVNTHTGLVVKRALCKYHQGSVKFTDSQIALHWITNDNHALKQWTRNRVIEIRRFTEKSDWKYVKSEHMIADMGTRRCNSLKDVDEHSFWYSGYDWMKLDQKEFPCKSAEELILDSKENEEMSKELQIVPYQQEIFQTFTDEEPNRDKIKMRYIFSEYVIDPNHRSFHTVLRILALVIKFIRKWKQKKDMNVNHEIQDETWNVVLECDLKAAEKYFFKKATKEIQNFIKPNQVKQISREVDEILYFTGRILPEDEFTIVGKATTAMTDLCSTTFCTPLVDRFSPIAYAIVNDVHWNDKTVQHLGVETTWRDILQYVHIVEGRSLVRYVRENCQRCRYLRKKTLEVAMGPVSKYNTTIAPAYYNSFVDLAGPFSAYSSLNKRATLKIWLTVFCCSTTTAVNIKIMDSYNTSAFIQAFTRFACEVGYPKRILADEGSQIVKGCNSLAIDILDLKFQLQRDVAVDFDICPVGGHNMNGRVERKIRQIKESIVKSLNNERLGLLQWETLAATIANSINNLPLTLMNYKAGFEMMDLITPNRLLLGRNNNRSPQGSFTLSHGYEKLLEQNRKIYEAWFENWLVSHVPKLLDQPKWFKSDRDIKEGDIILFLKHDSEINSTYQYGIVESVIVDRDGKIRKAHVRYRNSNENTDRFSFRAVRTLVVIHPVDEISVMQELGQLSAEVDREREANHQSEKEKLAMVGSVTAS